MEGLECLDVSRPSNLIADFTGRQIGKPSGREPIAMNSVRRYRRSSRPPSSIAW